MLTLLCGRRIISDLTGSRFSLLAACLLGLVLGVAPSVGSVGCLWPAGVVGLVAGPGSGVDGVPESFLLLQRA